MTSKARKIIPETTTASDVINLLNASLAALVKYQDDINRLNVYPVPDGDTGTNMVLTMKSVCDEAAKVEDVSVKQLSKAITYGSLMGARGNSGVILSQIIRGFCEYIETCEEITLESIAGALTNGANTAYKAVKKPVEGTMLTVIRDMAKAADSLSGKETRLADLLGLVIEEGEKSVARTPDLLPILKESGVVDAGGYGLVIMAKGILAAQKGTQLVNGIGENTGAMTFVDEAIEFAYCTEFILKSDGVDMEDLESKLVQLGDSLLVVGTPELTKIHVHTNDPGKVLQIATGMGTMSEIQINNIIEQSEMRAQALRKESLKPKESGIGIVAVTNGSGIRDILVSLGASKIVSGGQSMNPSTAELVKAVNGVSNNEVIILPNNSNIIMSAQQVAGLTDKKVMVVPTKSVVEAFSAMLAFDESSTIEENAEAMTNSCKNVKTGEVTYAIRDAKRGDFMKGDTIGLFNGSVKASGGDIIQVTISLLEEMIGEDDEVLTILAGDKVDTEQIGKLSEMIEDRFSEIEVDIHSGNQPVYHFIIGVE